MRKRKGKVFQKLALTLSAAFLLTGCNAVKTGSPDDYATNKGYEQSEGDTAQKGEGGISKDQIKVGVLYLSDPDEGSGYSYTHDLGVKGMQENLLLSDDQIERKIVDDTDEDGTKKAIEECVSDGCNIIFTTSGAICRLRLIWRRNIRMCISLMAQDICPMERTSTTILEGSIRQGI